MPHDPDARDGSMCSVCEQIFQPQIGSAAKMEHQDHKDPFDCIRHLKARIRELEKGR